MNFKHIWTERVSLGSAKMASEEKQKQRTNIQFCVNLGKTPVQTMELLNRYSRKSTAVCCLVYKWHNIWLQKPQFSEGKWCPSSSSKSTPPPLSNIGFYTDKGPNCHHSDPNKISRDFASRSLPEVTRSRSFQHKILFPSRLLIASNCLFKFLMFS